MAVARKSFRNRMLLTTATAALAATLPSAAHAQLVRSTDLGSAIDSAGNPNQLTVTDTNATTTDIEVEAAVVVAEWTDFNIDLGDTVNVTIDAGLGLSEATLFNRVIGANPSNINGILNAPDINFWLINQNGIVFGANTAITTQSFFASTIDVANQDLFDFYEGTDVFGNGTDLMNFAGPSAAGIVSNAGASFITDGTLAFTGQSLNLTGSFDAQTGQALFLSAADVDVTFTPGSPLSYTVNAGTTIATGLSVDGTVEGASAEFGMITAAGVVGALLNVDADVTATTAVATDRGVRLVAQGLGVDKPDVAVGGVISTNGTVEIASEGAFTTTQAITGSDVAFDVAGTMTAANITATAGGVDIDGSTIAADTISATGDIDVDATNSITFNNAFADTDADNAGSVTLGQAVTPSTINISGTASGGSVFVRATDINAGDITATAGDATLSGFFVDAGAVGATGGDVLIDAISTINIGSISANAVGPTGGNASVRSNVNGAVDVGPVTADGDVTLDTTNTLLTDAITAGGALSVGGISAPSAVTFDGNVSAESIDVDTVGGFTSLNLTATDGDLDIGASSIDADVVGATGGNVILQAAGNVTTASITSLEAGATGGGIDVDSTGGGTLDLGALTADGASDLDTTGTLTLGLVDVGGAMVIGGTAVPATLNLNDAITAGSFASNTTGAFTTANSITTTDGDLDIVASSISTGALDTGNGGGVTLTAAGTIDTASITADEAGGFIDAQSTGGGALDLGALAAGGDIDVDTTGSFLAGAVAADGAFTVGAVDAPSSVTVAGNVDAGSVDWTTTGAIDALDIVADNGAIALVAGTTVTAGILSATDDIDIDAAGIVALTSITADSDDDDNGDVTVGAVTVPVQLNVSGPISGTNVDLAAAAINVGDVSASRGDATMSTTVLTAGNIIATRGDVTLGSNTTITTGNITSIRQQGNGGRIDIDSYGPIGNSDITVGDLSPDSQLFIDTFGVLTHGTIDAPGGQIKIGTVRAPSLILPTGPQIGADFDINVLFDYTAEDITATAGGISIVAPNIETGDLTTTGGDVILNTPGTILTGNIDSNMNGALVGGAIDIDSTGGNSVTLGSLDAEGQITLDTTGPLAFGAVNQNTDPADVGALIIGGLNSPSLVTFGGDILAASFDFTSSDTFTVDNVETTNGTLRISAVLIDSVSLTATGGNVVLISGSSVTADTVGSTGGFVDIDSTGGGNVSLGTVTSTTNDIFIDTTGAVVIGNISAGNLIRIGETLVPSSVTFTGDITAASFAFATTAPFNVGNVTSTAGAIDIDAPSISAGAISSTGGDTILTATGDITTTGVTSTNGVDIASSGGNLSLGSVAATLGNVVLSAGGDITTTFVGSSAGSVDIDSTGGGALDLGDVFANTTASLDTTGSVTTGAITAGGALTIGALAQPSGVRFTENITALSISILSGGAIVGLDVTDTIDRDLQATGGNVEIAGASLSVGAVSAAGGDVSLQTDGDISVSDTVSATASLGVGGAVAALSTSGGNLSFADIAAESGINLDTTGSITAGTLNADSDGDLAGDIVMGGSLTSAGVTVSGPATGANIGVLTSGTLDAGHLTATNGIVILLTNGIVAGTVQASDAVLMSGGTGAVSIGDVTADAGVVTVTGASIAAQNVSATGGNVTLNSSGAVTALDVISTAVAGSGGSVNVDAGSFAAGAVTADGGDAVLLADGAITTTSVDATGLVDIDSTVGGNLSLGTVSGDGGVLIDGTANIATGSLDSSAGVVDVASTGGTLTLGAVSGAGGVELDATGAITTTSIDSSIGVVDVETTGGLLDLGSVSGDTGVTLVGTANITTSSIEASSGSVDVDTTGGDLDLGSVTGTNGVELTATGDITTALIDADAGLVDVDTTGGSLDLGTVSGTSGVELTATGDITTTSIDSSAGAVDVDTTGGVLLLGDVNGATGVALTGTSDITTTSVGSTAGLVDIDTTGGDLALGTVAGASGVQIDGTGETSAVSVDSSGGSVDVATTGGALSLGTVDGNSGVGLSATGDISTDSIGSLAGAIDVASSGGDLDLGDLGSLTDTTLDASGTVTTGSVTASGAFAVGQSSEVASADFQGDVSAASIAVESTGAVTGGILEATAGDLVVDAGSISGSDLIATGDVTLDAAGGVSLAIATADSDLNGAGALSIGATTPSSDVTIAGSALGTAITIRTDGGPIAIGSNPAIDALEASGGDILLEAAGAGGSIDVQAQVAATGGDVSLQTGGTIIVAGDVDANALAGVGGQIDAQSTGGGDLAFEALLADNGILLDTAGSVTVNGAIDSDADGDNVGDLLIGSRIPSALDVNLVNPVSAPNISISTTSAFSSGDITATNGSVDVNAGSIAAGNLAATGDVTLDAAGAVVVASAIADTDNSGSGAVAIGVDEVAASITVGSGNPGSIDFGGGSSLGSFVGGEVSGSDVTLVSNGVVATGDVSATPGNVEIVAASGDVRVDALTAGDFTIETGGTLRIDGDVSASGDGSLQSDNLQFAGAVNAANSLTLRANEGQDVLVGDPLGDAEATGDFHISDAELDAIVTGTLIIDAGSGNIDIATVSFTDQAGSDQVAIVNRGAGTVIEIEGDITAAGLGRVIQIGENLVGASDITGEIIAKIEKSTIDIGEATLDLQANNIVFGSGQLLLELGDLQGVSADVVAFNFVGNSGSILFNPDAPLASARAGNEVYLRAGNLSVTYGEVALFQNTLPITEGDLKFAGVVIGDDVGQNGTLTLRPTDETNAFNMFGELNALDDEAVAFAPEPALIIDGQISVFGSRINGCLIRSGADCITTVVDTTIIQIPREAVSLLTADPDVFLPFDPLVGTNNEGLFSGAAAGPGDDCERDEDGLCR